MSKILSIEAVEDYKYKFTGQHPPFRAYETGDGYIVKTDEQDIVLVVDNDSCCCEQWGYVQSDDDLSAFIGAELLNFYATDDGLRKCFEYGDQPSFEGGIMFVTFETNAGSFQLAVYNEHNGYYSHEAVLLCNDPSKEHREVL